MNEKIKKYLGLAGIITLLAVSWGVIKFVSAYNASIQPSSFRSFAVSAEGKATSIPDVAKFTYSVITEGGKDIKGLTAKNTEQANAIIDFLKSNSINKADIKTISYNIQPRTQYYNCAPDMNGGVRPCPPSETVGYTISQSVEVKIKDFSKIGDILNGVVSKGANNVSELQFTTDDPTKVQDLARADAITKAIARAKIVASAGGFKIGRLLAVDESNNYYSAPMPYYATAGMAKSSVDMAPAPSIEPGSQETTVSVTMRYEIK